MSTAILLLATTGGLVSFLSTSFGALLSLKSFEAPRFLKFKFSIDFALGLMLSAVAFSLVGPAAASSMSEPGLLRMSLAGFAVGGVLIYGLKVLIEHRQSDTIAASSSQLLLALALIVHNFPEGLASGASLAGLSARASMPILSSIAVQNIPEGLIMVLCLRSLGWRRSTALLGGLASGLVELLGGILAGMALSWASHALPIILMVAGGAMFTSVVIELTEKGSMMKQLRKPEFAIGLLSIPLLNLILGQLLG